MFYLVEEGIAGILIGGFDRGPVYPSQVHMLKAALYYSGREVLCVHFNILLVLCKYLIISDSLKFKD